MSSPLVSILINNYNYGRFLADAIESALAQTYPHIEVIVVDDGSTDESRQVIERYGERIIPVFKENGGHASALNAGFGPSQGEILCFLDADDMYLPGKVEAVVGAFAQHPESQWCFHQVYNWNATKDDLPTHLNPRGIEDPVPIDFRAAIRAGKQPNFIPQTSAISFRRPVLERILPIPQVKGTSVGDTYMSTVAVMLEPGCVINQMLTIYRIHGKNIFTLSFEKLLFPFSQLRVTTGYWMLKNWPEMRPYVNVFVAKGIGVAWLVPKDPSHAALISEYLGLLPWLERLQVLAWAGYYALKARLRGVIP